MPIIVFDVVRAIWKLRHDRGFVSLSILLLFALGGGTGFYTFVEDLTPLDAAYLSVITLTTVGYGDPAPATAAGKVFTSVYVLGGMGILVAFLSTISTHIRDHGTLQRPLARVAARHATRHAGSPARAAHPSPTEVSAAAAAHGGYDLVVVGSDEQSRRTALEAAQLGLKVVIVARHGDIADATAGRPGVGSDRLTGHGGGR